MAITYQNIVTTVEDMLDRTDLRNPVLRCIGNVIESLNRKPFYPLEFRGAELSAVQGQVWYDEIDLTNGAGYVSGGIVSTQDILFIQYMRRVQDADPQMWFLRYDEFERRQEGTDIAAFPSWYTMHNGQIGIWPTPQEDETLYISAWIKTTEQDDWTNAELSESIAWTNEARSYIESAAARQVAQLYIQDAELAALFGTQEDRLFRELIADSNRRQSKRRIKSHGL